MAKVGDLLKAKTPTGQTVDLANPMSYIQYILGAFFLIFTFAWGQRMGYEVNNKLPSGLREEIDPITREKKTEQSFDMA